MTSQILAAVSAIGLLGAGFATTGETRSFQAMPAANTAFADGEGSGAGEKCRVDVVRTGAPGTAEVTRAVLDGGGCVCTVTTGASDGNGSAESIVSRLVSNRECNGAPSTTDNGGGGAGPTIPLVLTGLSAVALAVVIGDSSNG